MTTPEPTFDMNPSPGRPAGWYPLRFEPGPAEQETCRAIVIEHLNRATGWKLNRKRWEKQGTFTLQWKDEKGNPKAVSARFKDIVEAMCNQRTWPENLPPIKPCWFESSVALAMTFHAPGTSPVPASIWSRASRTVRVPLTAPARTSRVISVGKSTWMPACSEKRRRALSALSAGRS